MKQRIALAYSGSLASTAAIAWLQERHDADVVTVTLDVGQTVALDDVRSRALSAGARRAHVIDAREVFARKYAVPGVRAGVANSALVKVADPLIARALLDVAPLERVNAVAHVCTGERGVQLSEWIAYFAPTAPIVTPAVDWAMDDAALAAYARARSLPIVASPLETNFLIRRPGEPSRAPETPAHLDIDFADGVPIAINGVAMPVQELLESLSLIGGQYALGHGDSPPSPAATVLRAAYAVVKDTDDSVRVTVERDALPVVAIRNLDSQLVKHP